MDTTTAVHGRLGTGNVTASFTLKRKRKLTQGRIWRTRPTRVVGKCCSICIMGMDFIQSILTFDESSGKAYVYKNSAVKHAKKINGN